MIPTTQSGDRGGADPAAPARVGRKRSVKTLSRRAEYLRVRGGRKWGTGGFLLEGKRREDGAIAEGPRFGFTVTKKIGTAVVRNRIKRRLKAAAGELLDEARPDHDYVLVARLPAFTLPFQTLRDDLRRALSEVHRQGPRQSSGHRR